MTTVELGLIREVTPPSGDRTSVTMLSTSVPLTIETIDLADLAMRHSLDRITCSKADPRLYPVFYPLRQVSLGRSLGIPYHLLRPASAPESSFLHYPVPVLRSEFWP